MSLRPRLRRGRDRLHGGAVDPSLSTMSEASRFLTGHLLLAMPHLSDERFAHSVIYLCAHTPEGAMGIVVNRPLLEPTFPDMLRQLSIDPLPPARSIRLCVGGPVENGRGFVLHTADWTTEGTLKVDDRLALTANLDVLKALAEGGGPELGILALGYAGWGPGQLDIEIQQNAWLTVPMPDPVMILGDDYAGMWRRALATIGIDPLLLSSAAGHA